MKILMVIFVLALVGAIAASLIGYDVVETLKKSIKSLTDKIAKKKTVEKTASSAGESEKKVKKKPPIKTFIPLIPKVNHVCVVKQLDAYGRVLATHTIDSKSEFFEKGKMVGVPILKPDENRRGLLLTAKMINGEYDMEDDDTYAAFTVPHEALLVCMDEEGLFLHIGMDSKVCVGHENKMIQMEENDQIPLTKDLYVLVGSQYLKFCPCRKSIDAPSFVAEATDDEEQPLYRVIPFNPNRELSDDDNDMKIYAEREKKPAPTFMLDDTRKTRLAQ